MRKKMMLIGALLIALGLVLIPIRSEAAPVSVKVPASLQSRILQIYSGSRQCDSSCACPSSGMPVTLNNDVAKLLEQYLGKSCMPKVQEPEASQPAEEKPQMDQPTTSQPVEEKPQVQEPSAEQTMVPAQNPTYEEQVVALVNAERAKVGLPALVSDAKLQEAALARAKETVTLFSHTRPNGTSCFTILKEFGISYRSAGENIAYGQRSPEEVVNAWMNSEGHRANILNKNFTTIGIGYYQTANGTKYWSQLFTS